MLAEHLTEVAIVVLAEVGSLVLLAVTVFVQFVRSCSSRTTCLPSFPCCP